MANEIDRGQASGEVATRQDTLAQNTDARASGNGAAKLSDLGISSQRVSEWRETRDAGPEVVEQAIQSALDEGRVLSEFAPQCPKLNEWVSYFHGPRS
jgi:hypothetical protein